MKAPFHHDLTLPTKEKEGGWSITFLIIIIVSKTIVHVLQQVDISVKPHNTS